MKTPDQEKKETIKQIVEISNSLFPNTVATATPHPDFNEKLILSFTAPNGRTTSGQIDILFFNRQFLKEKEDSLKEFHQPLEKVFQ